MHPGMSVPIPPERSTQEDVLARSMAFVRVQRIGVGILTAALLACGPAIGWAFLAPLAVTLVVFVVLKHPVVQQRFGVITSWLTWAAGLVGCAFIIGVSAGPIEYLLPAIAIPTVLGSSIFPIRTIPLQALATIGAAFATVAIADPTALRERTAVVVIAIAVLGAVILNTTIARTAESSSYLESREDILTGAFNRVALADHLREMQPDVGHFALILGDVDGFKAVNDEHGHPHGDRVLQAMAAYLRGRLPDGARLYRFGGEEFLISLVGEPARDAPRLAEEMRAGVATIAVDGVAITMSFGVASSPRSDPKQYDALFAAADAALYDAKAGGRNAVRIARPLLRAIDGSETWQTTDDLDRTAAGRRHAGLAGPRTALIHDEVEREQLVDLMQRQFHGTRIADLILVLPMVLFHERLGWLPIALALPTLFAFRYIQLHAVRYPVPEHWVAPAWLVMQAMIGVILLSANGDVLWALSVFSTMLVASSAAFPWRAVRWGALYSAVVVTLTALLAHGDDVLTHYPQSIATSLGLLLACTIVGREIGGRILAMRRAASIDPLTGLPNRGAFERRAATAIHAAATGGLHAALILGDIDHFKLVNDRFGHHRGDNVLVAVASRIQSRLRHEGSLFRIGGEEFCVVLTGLAPDECAGVAERLRGAIADGPVAGVELTMSFGVATGTGVGGELAVLAGAADRALYRAKNAGRNRVVVAGGDDFVLPPHGIVSAQPAEVTRTPRGVRPPR